MLFSVIIPVYNSERYLEKCIDSILNQSFSDFEIILVDDGSTDKSPTICENYKELDCRVRVLHKKNEGANSARKIGANMAIGDYIIPVDSDDFLDQGYFFDVYLKVINNRPDLLFYDFKSISIDSIKVHTESLSEGLYSKHQISNIQSKFIYDKDKRGINTGVSFYSIWSKVFKKDIFIQSQSAIPNNIVFGEDMMLSYISLSLANSLVVSHKAFYNYTVINESIMRSAHLNNFSKYIDTFSFMSKYCHFSDESVGNFALMCIDGEMCKLVRSSMNLAFFKEKYQTIDHTYLIYTKLAKYKKTNIKTLVKKIAINYKLVTLIYLGYKLF